MASTYGAVGVKIQRAKERLYVRRVKRRTYIVSPMGQPLLCVPCVVQKREYVNEVNNVPDIPIYRGKAEREKLHHGYVAEKTSPRASAYAPEGTEKKPIVFRLRGVIQKSQL